jgi:hypothetical protein
MVGPSTLVIRCSKPGKAWILEVTLKPSIDMQESQPSSISPQMAQVGVSGTAASETVLSSWKNVTSGWEVLEVSKIATMDSRPNDWQRSQGTGASQMEQGVCTLLLGTAADDDPGEYETDATDGRAEIGLLRSAPRAMVVVLLKMLRAREAIFMLFVVVWGHGGVVCSGNVQR